MPVTLSKCPEWLPIIASYGELNVLSITTNDESEYYILINLMLLVNSIDDTGGPHLSCFPKSF